MATKWDKTPSGKEDVLQRAAEDTDKVKKALDAGSSKLKGGAQQAVKEAGGRALLRNVGRAGAISSAVQAGLEIGSEINRRNPEIGKAIVEKSGLGDAVERAVKRGHEGVKLTPEARERVMTGETVERPAKRDRSEDTDGMKKGGKVSSASKRADGIASRGKTKGKMY